MALAMIEGAERDGLISRGDTIVEYTGGSTGRALALVCRAKVYRALIVIADCFTEERFQLMRALGAELDVVPSLEGRPNVTARDIENMVARAAEIANRPGHYATDQFNNPYIIPDHRDRLGREIWEQTDGRVTAFCHAMGTASSLMGVSEALKPRGVFIQAHEPAGSAAISGGKRGAFLIQGWTGLVMPHWHPERVDPGGADRRRGGARDDAAAGEGGRHLRRNLDRRQCRRRASPRRQSRTRRGDRHPRRRHRLQVHERRAIHRQVEAQRRSRSRESTCQPSPDGRARLMILLGTHPVESACPFFDVCCTRARKSLSRPTSAVLTSGPVRSPRPRRESRKRRCADCDIRERASMGVDRQHGYSGGRAAVDSRCG
jgi:Pyridoxal-phosphate dependent enzyme